MAKQKMSNKKFLCIVTPVLGFVLIFAIVATALCSTLFYGILTTFFDGGEKVIGGKGEIYYEAEAVDHDAAIRASRDFIKEIQGEGTVLLKNDGFLPMRGDEKLTLFGRDSVDFMYGGGGSGGLSKNYTRKTLFEILENSGFTVNPTVWDLLDKVKSKYDRGSSGVNQLLSVGEIPLSEYTAEAKSSYKRYNDCAIAVFGRSGSEGTDLFTGSDTEAHALELEKDERDVLAEACANFDNVVVIINSSSTLELGFLDEFPQIRAALYTGFTGDTGLEVIGDILKGSINPSGHTVDTFAYDLTTAPSYVNMTSSGFGYTNLDDHWFVEYEEGIYVGYRWYETADATGFWSSDYAKKKWSVNSYAEVVQFPFGYGKSYGEFDWALDDADWTVDARRGGKVSVTVNVTNKHATLAGKDVVQLYLTAPYDPEEGIEKSSVVLCGFAKTPLIPAGETRHVTITADVDDFASYDYLTEKAYVLSAGEYTLSLRTDAHTVKAGANMTKTFDIGEKIVYGDGNGRASDKQPAENRFDDVSSHIGAYLTRSDFVGTMPTAPSAADKTASQAVIDGVKPFVYDTYANESMPTTDANNGVELVDLVGKAYDDPMWEDLLDNLTVGDMDKLVSIGGYKTVKADSVNKPPTVDADGPVGFTSFFTKSIYGAGFCSEVVIASTWNEELAEKMGKCVGEEGLSGGYAGWYAPGMNIHRSAFGGRNFEYYGEDGLLSGRIGAAVIRGCAEKGVYCYVKHFALNDQETKRDANGLLTWANEQSMREIYLRPFEIAVKEGKTTAIMSSFNRIGTVWAGGNRELLVGVLRDEWGFNGTVITDYDAGDFMYSDQMLSAGGDVMMNTLGKHPSDTSSPAAVAAMRAACKNILYTVAGSHAMNGVQKGVGIRTAMPVWVKVEIAIDVIVFAGLCVGTFFVVRRVLKNRKSEETSKDI